MKKYVIIGTVILIAVSLFFYIFISAKSNEDIWQERHYLISDSKYLGTHNYKKHNINTDLIIDDKNISEMILTLLNVSHNKENIPAQYNNNISSDVYKSLSPIPPKLNTPFWSKCDFDILSIKYTKTKMVVDYCYSYSLFSCEDNNMIQKIESSCDAPPKIYLEYIEGRWVIINKIELF